jgi:hypothetical protein
LVGKLRISQHHAYKIPLPRVLLLSIILRLIGILDIKDIVRHQIFLGLRGSAIGMPFTLRRRSAEAS